MDTLDGFVLNIFRTDKPVLSKDDFDNDDAWVCDLLDQDIELAKEFTKHKLASCKDRMDKLEFLYTSRSCFRSTIKDLKRELNPEYKSDYYFYRNSMTIEQMEGRLTRYKQALSMIEQAICHYVDCKASGILEAGKAKFEYSNSQLVLIFYYFFKLNGLEPRVSIDIAPIAKFLHLVTGKEFKTVNNSDFYKKLQAVPNFKTDKELIKDLEAIKPLFQRVELKEIVKMIDNEMEMARTQLRLSN